MEKSINPAEIVGTGVGGRILKKDVLSYIDRTSTNQDRSDSASSIGNQRIQNPLLSHQAQSSSKRKQSEKEAGTKKKEVTEPVSDQNSVAGISAILADSLKGNQRIQNPLLSNQTQSSSKKKLRKEKEPGTKKKEEAKPGLRGQKRKVDDDEDNEEKEEAMEEADEEEAMEEATEEAEEKADKGKGRIKCDFCNKLFNCPSSKFNHIAMSHFRHEVDAFKKPPFKFTFRYPNCKLQKL